jgi:uncharacterized pyridoxamine 5'-phosphate oxidase family protein
MNITKEYILSLFDRDSKRANYTWHTYQPINYEGFEITQSQAGRMCADRSNAIIEHIKNNIPDYQNKTYIDWGCNLGYFIFDIMKSGCSTIGVDKNIEYINICNFITDLYNNSYKKPIFVNDGLNKDTIEKYQADIALCFSVIHHMPRKDQLPVLLEFANKYRQCYIEMDGHNYGYDLLKIFYWNLDLVIEANDKYGKGTRKRKTWFCNNVVNNFTYTNIKFTNLLSGRSVFKKTNNNTQTSTVIKRENLSFAHTWIKTNIAHEANIYKIYQSNFIPTLVNYQETSTERILEIEYIDSNSTKGSSLEEIFNWLKTNNLKLIDYGPSQFIKTKNGYVMVDLESIVHQGETEKFLRNPSHPIKTDAEQLQYLLRMLK